MDTQNAQKGTSYLALSFLCLRYFLHVSVKVHGIHCLMLTGLQLLNARAMDAFDI